MAFPCERMSALLAAFTAQERLRPVEGPLLCSSAKGRRRGRTPTSSRQRSATGRVEHDLGRAFRGGTRADLHDLIEPGERLELVPLLGRIVQQRQQRGGKPFGGAVVLQQLRDDILA